ncbi:MAG: (2Fe-2S)-binding protein [Proteobacteria bacterium]|nr:(2Fe-2S)-binding protein [Pseudomonadota bacterium]
MYVCVCKAVTDSEIREAALNGAATIEDIAETLGAGTGCGCCREMTQHLIDQQHTDHLTHAA